MSQSKCLCCGKELAMRTRYATTANMLRMASSNPIGTLTPEIRLRLTWIQWYEANGRNKSLTARHFGISRPTFDYWFKRYNPKHLRTLENKSTRPHRYQQPKWTSTDVIAIRDLRKQYPRWGKKKLVVLLRRMGRVLSQSTIGRILKYLRHRGELHIPNKRCQLRSRKSNRPHAIRKPKEYQPTAPGDLLQIDTVDLRPVAGEIFKQLSMVDVVSRWSALEVSSAATARLTRNSMQRILDRLPFRPKAIQIDGGSEFMSEFETWCQENNLKLFVLPPHSPKLNGRVERFNRTSREEFHECTNADLTVAALQTAGLEWEASYNTIRPHEALGQLTPAEYLEQCQIHQEVTS